jgi:hypothetical protein
VDYSNTFPFETMNEVVSFIHILAGDDEPKTLLDPFLRFRGLEMLKLVELDGVDFIEQWWQNLWSKGVGNWEDYDGNMLLVLEFLKELCQLFWGMIPQLVIEE